MINYQPVSERFRTGEVKNRNRRAGTAGYDFPLLLGYLEYMGKSCPRHADIMKGFKNNGVFLFQQTGPLWNRPSFHGIPQQIHYRCRSGRAGRRQRDSRHIDQFCPVFIHNLTKPHYIVSRLIRINHGYHRTHIRIFLIKSPFRRIRSGQIPDPFPDILCISFLPFLRQITVIYHFPFVPPPYLNKTEIPDYPLYGFPQPDNRYIPSAVRPHYPV